VVQLARKFHLCGLLSSIELNILSLIGVGIGNYNFGA
jgi:hypothetical protein